MNDDAIRRFLGANTDGLVRLAQDLVRTNSITGNETALAHLCADWFAANGLQTRLWPAKGRQNVTGSTGAGSTTVVLSGHLDTVPCDPAAWSVGPFDGMVKDARLYGLGASDMKASLACIAFALKFLSETRAPGRVVRR